MSTLEANKQTVVSFYETAFNDHQPEVAVEKYVGARYLQHNPLASDGAEAFIEFVRGYSAQFPALCVDIRTVLAEGDLVVTHGLITTDSEDRGTVAVDIFRIEEGRIVEHWDVLQPFPETSANAHPMF